MHGMECLGLVAPLLLIGAFFDVSLLRSEGTEETLTFLYDSVGTERICVKWPGVFARHNSQSSR
jgi:hypothetical protein